MNKKPQPPPDPKQVVLAALNEQGFLFQQIIREKVRNQIKGDTDTQAHWTFVACEYPVTAADGSQTRIDLTSGTITTEDLKLAPLEFCAVNYRPDDSTARARASLAAST